MMIPRERKLDLMAKAQIQSVEAAELREMPFIPVGSTVRVAYRIVEGNKERVQPFEGVVIRKHGGENSPSATFTVRKISQGFGVERIFPLHSPRIESVTVLRQGRIRRAKLYYLRALSGKKARIREKKPKGGY